MTSFRRVTAITTWVLLLWLSRIPAVFFDFPLVSYAVYACIAAAFALGVARAFAGGQHGLVSNAWMWLFIVVLAAAGVRGMMSVGGIPPWLLSGDTADYGAPWVYVRSVVLPELFVPMLAVLIATSFRDREDLKAVLIPIAVFSAAMALLILVNVFTSGTSLMAMAQADERNEHLANLGFHSNEFGTMLAIAYALLLGAREAMVSQRGRILMALTLGLTGAALVLTFSRGAYVAFAVTNILFFMRASPGRKGILVGLLLLLWFVAPAAILDRAGYALESKDINEISAGRVDNIWTPLMPDISEHLLTGQGLHSIMWTDAQRMQLIFPVSLAHNAYLDLLLDVGILGSLPILGCYFYIWRGFWRQSTRDDDPEFRAFFYGGHLALIALAVCALTNDRLTATTPTALLWMAAGVLVGRQSLQALARRTTSVARSSMRLGGTIGIPRTSRELWGH